MSEELSTESASSTDHGSATGRMSHVEYLSSVESKRSLSSNNESDLARIETRAVNWSKKFVLFNLLIAAAACVTATYYYTSREEANDFESQFTVFAVDVVNLSQHEAKNIFRSVKSTATTTTSLAHEIDAKWPFVTIPHFIIHGAQVKQLTNAIITGFSPLVSATERAQWEKYSIKSQGWIKESHKYNFEMMKNGKSLQSGVSMSDIKLTPISDSIFRMENNEQVVETDDSDKYLPMWQLAPVPLDTDLINYNLLSHPLFSRVYHIVESTKQAVLSEVFSPEFIYRRDSFNFGESTNITNPHSVLFEPVFDHLQGLDQENKGSVVGIVYAVLPWENYFKNLLPKDVQGVIVVVNDTCGSEYTYRLNGAEAIYVGKGDLHDPMYNELAVTERFYPFGSINGNETTKNTADYCEFFLNIYPSHELEDVYMTRKPILYTTVVSLVFFFTSMLFIVYDFFVQRQQDKVMVTAKRSNAIVSTLFPANVRERILEYAEERVQAEMSAQKSGFRRGTARQKLKDILGGDGVESDHNSMYMYDSKPIADLFPAATIMFADITGFNAWSSVREPTQVFQLLETVYAAFDEIGKRRRVFKVETVGDCYVGAAGLPEPRADHAVVMARFARDCLHKMNELAKKLEVSLGPDTGDLSMRMGLHSGPVTAGVLRGDKSRFQLFGDTVNTASRMESNGKRNKIHISEETADLLRADDKSHWIKPREDKIFAKGKGELQTYWLDLGIPTSDLAASSSSTHKTGTTLDESDSGALVPPARAVRTASGSEILVHDKIATFKQQDNLQGTNAMGNNTSGENKAPVISDKIKRLVQWNADVLLRLLKQIIARRNATQKDPRHNKPENPVLELEETNGTVIDEVKEIIKLPRFDAKVAKQQEDPSDIRLGPKVTAQLRNYVTIIATKYHNIPFHNFEHASHVTMSVVKLLSRIVAPEDIPQDAGNHDNHQQELIRYLHDHTYGITSDPLTQFAVVLSALIHDVDHNGVPNAQLIKEKADVATIYKNKSVAEQNSVDIAWELLMDDNFKDLRNVIYSNNSELKRFRQLIVNSVMATDIVDKELKELRNARWDKAFQEKSSPPITTTPAGETKNSHETREDVNRKATIVIEHLIQASDVAHTMQHWHVYRKWNERFFQENIRAYRTGRAATDPVKFWYKGELGFFDFYIIPLAKKLRECGVFGVSSDEYLNYAMTNRKEWELKGEKVVAEMVEKYKDAYLT